MAKPMHQVHHWDYPPIVKDSVTSMARHKKQQPLHMTMVRQTSYSHDCFHLADPLVIQQQLLTGMYTQDAATLKSAVTQLQLNGGTYSGKENMDIADDSDWLHRNDAYHMSGNHHTQTHSSIFPTRTPGIMVHTVLWFILTTLKYCTAYYYEYQTMQACSHHCLGFLLPKEA